MNGLACHLHADDSCGRSASAPRCWAVKGCAMDRTSTQWRFRESDHDKSANEKTLGKVVAVIPDAYIDATKADVERPGWQQRPKSQPPVQARSAIKPPRDPVRGTPVEPSKAPSKSRCQGTVYSYCSWECKRAFDAHPERSVPVTHAPAPPVNDQHTHHR
jgi:YHS domain-containing protein